jgi:ribosome-associated protein
VSAIRVNERVEIPEDAVETKAVRSGGPGGQNVNKVASKIQMRVDLARLRGLFAGELERLRAFLASRLDAEGRLLIASQETRDQAVNREDCAEKAVALIRAGLQRPKFRRPTGPTRASRLRRVEAKRHVSQRLRDRRIEE